MAAIKYDDDTVRFYTGLPSHGHFVPLSGFLKDCSEVMPLWFGSRHETEGRQRAVQRSKRTLPLDDELFITLMKLRLNCPNQDLALCFSISTLSVSRIITTWLMLLHAKLKESAGLPAYLAKQRTHPANNPRTFSQPVPDTTVIIAGLYR